MSSQSCKSKTASDLERRNTDHDQWPSLLEQATAEVFTMMLGCEIESAGNSGCCEETACDDAHASPLIQVLFQDEAERTAPTGVTAVIGLAGAICGVLNFACGTESARLMAAKMLGIEEDAAGEQQWDAIGEICNMIAGNFKSKLPGIGDRCMLSVPTIVVGSHYRLRAVARKERVQYNFRVDGAAARVLLELQ